MNERLHATEAIVRSVVQWLKLGVEAVRAAVIGVGIFFALRLLLRMVWHREPPSFTAVRLSLARYLALEFQLGADILSTAIAPSWLFDPHYRPQTFEQYRFVEERLPLRTRLK